MEMTSAVIAVRHRLNGYVLELSRTLRIIQLRSNCYYLPIARALNLQSTLANPSPSMGFIRLPQSSVPSFALTAPAHTAV